MPFDAHGRSGIIPRVHAGSLRSSAVALGEISRNPAIRRIEIAWAAGTAADWAFLVILLVVAYNAGGALAVGLLGAVRVVPGIVAAPFAISLVERFNGNRVLTGINLVRAAGVFATAFLIGEGGSIVLVYALAAIVAGSGALVRPIQNALLPALARTPDELLASNVASSTGEGIGTFVGPLVASALVAWADATVASVVVAGIFLGAAAAAAAVRFERESDARGGLGETRRASRPHLREAPHTLTRYPGPMLLIGDFVSQTFVRGLLTTLIVVASIEVLGMGEAGVGMLTAAIGLGGLVGAIAALGLVAGRQLTTVFAIALAGWGLPLVIVGVIPVASLALAALFVTGVSNAVLDVSGFTLIQRGVANDDRVTVFALFEALLGLGLFAGSLLAPALVAVAGPRGALIVAGAILPILAVATWRPIIRRTPTGSLSPALLALFRGNPLFAPLPLTALDRLAESATRVSFSAGDMVMRQGDRGDWYLLISEGDVDVRDDDQLLGGAHAGEGVGEIALLREAPRMASVSARTDVSGYAIDAPTFLCALSGPSAIAAARAVAEARLAVSEDVRRAAAGRRSSSHLIQ